MVAPTHSINDGWGSKNKDLPLGMPNSQGDLTNYDPNSPQALGYLRWRHLGNKAGNFCFCDGHVETLQQSQIFNRNLLYDP